MKTIAIVVGHLPNDPGAYNDNLKVSEFDFNNNMAPLLAKQIRSLGYRPIIIYRETYTKLPGHVNETKADVCLSLHCNAFDDNPHGSEVLYYHASTSGKKLAQSIQSKVVGALGFPDRGIKPIDYNHVGGAGDRGGWLVEKTTMPAVIIEPFFIDASQSLMAAEDRLEGLVNAIAGGVDDYLKGV